MLVSNELFTEQEVAERLHLSPASLRRWRLEKRGPRFIKVGSLVRYRPEDLEEWLLQQPTGGSPIRKDVQRASINPRSSVA
jgi:excisionase family DNA binding protein